MGSKHLGLRVLKEIHTLFPNTLIGAMTIDDTNDTRTALDDFEKVSNDTGLPLYVVKNKKHAQEIIRNLQPELCLVVGWYWLINRETLEIPTHGFIGIHNSLLPKYRGTSPLIWAMINGEEEVGFSLFTFTTGMDDGPIWAQGIVKVENDDYISDVLKKLEEKVVEVVRKKYFAILEGTIIPVDQQHELATYCTQRFPDDGNINWNLPALYIYNCIRAQSTPYPGAFTWFRFKYCCRWKARLFQHDYYGIRGQVAKIDTDGVYVICGDHRAIFLEEVEVDGKKGKANEFIQSISTNLSQTIASRIVTG